jgi:hypothetical protein
MRDFIPGKSDLVCRRMHVFGDFAGLC